MAGILVTSFLGFNLEKLLEEQKINSSPSLEQTVEKHTVQQGINQSIPDQMHDSHSLVGSKTHSFVKQSSHVLPQVFVKDIDSKPTVASIPVESEGQPEVDPTEVKLSPRIIPKTKGWAPKLINKPTVTPKEVCIYSIDSHINGAPLCNQHNHLGLNGSYECILNLEIFKVSIHDPFSPPSCSLTHWGKEQCLHTWCLTRTVTVHW